MRTERESNIMAALFVLCALVIVWRVGYNVGRPDVDWLGYPEPTTTTIAPEPDPCNGEDLTYREDAVSVKTYAGDPIDGVLCSVVPKRLLFTE